MAQFDISFYRLSVNLEHFTRGGHIYSSQYENTVTVPITVITTMNVDIFMISSIQLPHIP